MAKPTHPLATAAAPACAGPRHELRAPNWPLPFGACDCHAHVIGDGYDFPFVAERSFTPPPASEVQYIRMLDGLGLTRGVLVQPSVHGTDNRLMLEVLRNHPRRLRGIAVVEPGVTDSALQAMHEAGVRGIRLNVSTGGGIGLDAMELLAARIAALGWHLQLLITPRRLIEAAPRLSGLPTAVVIDHMGLIQVGNGGTANLAFTTLLDLLKNERIWVKVSAAYRGSAQERDWTDIDPIATALIDAAPTRTVWGSDWPHAHFYRRMPPTGETLDSLARWLPDRAARKRVLVDNPATLYGF